MAFREAPDPSRARKLGGAKRCGIPGVFLLGRLLWVGLRPPRRGTSSWSFSFRLRRRRGRA